MQINSIWIDELARRYGASSRDVYDRLLLDGCFNVMVGTWILRTRIAEADGQFWRGVADYHSRTPGRGEGYAVRVANRAIHLFGPEVFTTGAPSIPPRGVADMGVQHAPHGMPVTPRIATPSPTSQAYPGGWQVFTLPLGDGRYARLTQEQLANLASMLDQQAAEIGNAARVGEAEARQPPREIQQAPSGRASGSPLDRGGSTGGLGLSGPLFVPMHGIN